VVYSRNIISDESAQELSFMASGSLWRDALVFMDRETRSLWTQHDGRALKGPAADRGLQLRLRTSHRTTWDDARARWPGARVLQKVPGIFGMGRRTVYDQYNISPEVQGIFGHRTEDSRLPAKALVHGFVTAGEAHAISLEHLAEGGSMLIEVDGQPALAVVLAGGQDARVWRGAGELSVDPGGAILGLDGRRWDAGSGASLDGGEALAELPGGVQFWFAWRRHHPETLVWPGQ